MTSNLRRRCAVAPRRSHALLLITAIALAASNASPASAKVLVTAQNFGVSASIYEFDDAGNLLGKFADIPGGLILSSIATDGTRVVAGRYNDGVRDYSLDGTFRGYLSGVPRPNYAAFVECDSRGNIYVTGADAPRRLNSDGTLSMTFPDVGVSMDADAVGNVYLVSSQSISKYSSSGVPLGVTSATQVVGGVADIAIDELGQMLYVGKSVNGMVPISVILAYDISSPTPAFVRSFAGPNYIAGISFDSTTGHVFGTNIFGGQVYEFASDGTVVQKYSFAAADSPVPIHAIDVVRISVPEASTSTMLAVGLICSSLVGACRRG